MRPIVAKRADLVKPGDRVLMGEPGIRPGLLFIAEVDDSFTSVSRWAVDTIAEPLVIRNGVEVLVLEA